MKFLHVFPDEKFIDGTIELFNESIADNDYVVLDVCKPYRYIKKYADEITSVKTNEFLEFICNKNYNVIMFHQLWFSQYKLVLNLPETIKVIWSSFGIDIYNGQGCLAPLCEMDLYKPITKKIFIKNRYIYNFAKKCVYYLRHKYIQNLLLSRLDYMATVLPIEYDMIKEKTKFSAQYIPFQYVSKKNTFEANWINSSASNILLGNSATTTNNHLDILKILKDRNITNNCYVPCAYGNYAYLEKLQKATHSNPFVHMLLDFMPYDEYEKLLKSCRIAVFGHVRQQAIGNIVIAMLQGSKVFLYSDSVAYKYFKKEGYIIYTIENDLTLKNIEELMTDEERENNRRKVEKQFSFTHVKTKLNSFLKDMCLEFNL